jgi:uncharacterized protein YndB with AHSA1/START domain
LPPRKFDPRNGLLANVVSGMALVAKSSNSYPDVMKGSVTVDMAASPERVWSLVSDVTKMGKFSPETFEAEWLDEKTGPAVGVRFRGHVRRNGKVWLVYWTICTITCCEPGQELAFDVKGPSGKPAVTWRYHLEPHADGTNVTESFELGNSLGLRVYAFFARASRTRTNVRNMRMTLERIKAVAESQTEMG